MGLIFVGDHVLKEGSVTLTYNPDGDSPQTGEIKEGEAVAQGQPHSVTAIATALNTKILAIPAGEARSLLATEAGWGKR